MRVMPRTAEGSDGYVLLAVLWVLIVASAIAAEIHASVRADQRVAANARSSTRARWAARGGVARAVESLRARLAITAATGTALRAGDTLLLAPDTLELDGVVVVTTVTDARARLPLNLATAPELNRLFLALGWDPERATARAGEITRWRVAHLPVVETAPPDSVRLRPPPGAFASVEELRRVAGITPAEYASVEPYLTVVSDGRINVNTATAPVLRALAGMDSAAAAGVVERRARTPLSTVYDLGERLSAGGRRVPPEVMEALAERAAFAPREAEIRARSLAPGAPVRATVRAVAVMTGGTRLPVVAVVER